ncbi:hypothetical protein [Rhodoplanes roseus]|uniref:Uncharacterized protein n=1 Tax=Rhodoplanes roseus TaxID=29409 RepID=A0A327KW64_9BRAD|nr:hypothetical protein [Rhodoplanes roseus]RAI42234.1 hypothetical protein CH341_20050 [Rhodoplanes roseus]
MALAFLGLVLLVNALFTLTTVPLLQASLLAAGIILAAAAVRWSGDPARCARALAPILAIAAAPVTVAITVILLARAGTVDLSSDWAWPSLCRYGLALGIIVAACGATLERRRAEWALRGLTAAAGMMAVVVIGHDLGGATFLGELGQGLRAGFDTIVALGVVLSAAVSMNALERRDPRSAALLARRVERLVPAVLAFASCAFAIGYFHDDALPMATAAGLGLFGLIVAVRRIGVGTWLGQGVLVIGGLAVTLVAVSLSLSGAVSARVAVDQSAEPIGWIGRAVLDFLPIAVAGVLLHGALRRRRDASFAAAAAACVLILMIRAHQDTSLFDLGPMAFAALVLGLGVAQRDGRPGRVPARAPDGGGPS